MLLIIGRLRALYFLLVHHSQLWLNTLIWPRRCQRRRRSKSILDLHNGFSCAITIALKEFHYFHAFCNLLCLCVAGRHVSGDSLKCKRYHLQVLVNYWLLEFFFCFFFTISLLIANSFLPPKMKTKQIRQHLRPVVPQGITSLYALSPQSCNWIFYLCKTPSFPLFCRNRKKIRI